MRMIGIKKYEDFSNGHYKLHIQFTYGLKVGIVTVFVHIDDSDNIISDDIYTRYYINDEEVNPEFFFRHFEIKDWNEFYELIWEAEHKFFGITK